MSGPHITLTDRLRSGSAEPLGSESKQRYTAVFTFDDPQDIPDLATVTALIGAIVVGDYVKIDGTSQMTGPLRTTGDFQVKDGAELNALLLGAGYRYLVGADGYSDAPIVDYSNAPDGSIPGGRAGLGVNTQGIPGRYGRLLFNLLTANRNYQNPDESGIYALINNTAYGSGWNGDVNKSPSSDVLYDILLSMNSAISAGSGVATPFDASTETTFPSGGTSTSKFRVTFPGTVQGKILGIGDVIYPLVSTPGPVASDWYVVQANIDQATSSILGLVKLYTTTGSNADGPMTQKAVTDLLAEIISLPAAPTPDGKTNKLIVVDEVLQWQLDPDYYDVSAEVIDKLQAEGAGDWGPSGKYVGTTSGTITIGPDPSDDCKPNDRFLGRGVVSLTDYKYECFPQGWIRTLIEL